MRACPECGELIYGLMCNCGYNAKKSKTELPKKERVPAYFIENFSDSELKNPVYGKVYLQQCSQKGCFNPGTMTHSTAHESSETATWFCNSHWR